MNTEELNSCYGSSDENTSRKKTKYVKFRLKIHMKDFKFFVGLLIGTKMMFKRAIEFYFVKWGKAHGWEKNDKNKIRAKCENLKIHLYFPYNPLLF